MAVLTENPFTWVYFPTALALGALHALEPGHAKALTAAYLIGIKGTKKDAFLLGLSVALTHSLVVVGVSVFALWLGREAFTQDVTRWLQVGSGVLVILLGIWMLLKRLRRHHHHHHADPIAIKSPYISGLIEIIQTPDGERMRFLASGQAQAVQLRVLILRSEGLEIIPLTPSATPNEFLSAAAPNEPHEFKAEFEISMGEHREVIAFAMHEHHEHDHGSMSDDEHARAHAAAIPEYVKRGERPTLLQITAFGAAGGMIPCPASITVMLLALSIGEFGSGLVAVAGFSIGLALTLVGIGLIVVQGISQLQGTGRFVWFSARAPVLSALVVILSGLSALLFVH